MFPIQRILLLTLMLLLIQDAGAQDALKGMFGVSVPELLARAEQGDVQAQYKLGMAYVGHADQTNAVFWLRKAARQGNAEAQYHLGMLFQYKSPAEGLKWLLLAANQNHIMAQVEAGHVFERGNVTKKDNIEAFKWYSLAGKQQEIWRAMWGDPLALKMTKQELEEAQNRVASFIPANPTTIEPELKLNGIFGTGKNRLALINGQTFKAGETAKVKVEDLLLEVRCLELQEKSIRVQVDGREKILQLNQ